MDIFSILFLVCVFLGVYAAFLIVERLTILHAAIVGNRTLDSDKWFDVKMFVWLACSTYNCWYLFVKGF